MTSALVFRRGLLVASFGLSAALYPRLPDAIPTHFDLTGLSSGFVAKPLGPFVVPLLGLVTYAITVSVLRRQHAGAALQIFPTVVSALFLGVNAVTLRAAIDDSIEDARLVVIGISLFIAVFGNYLGKLRRNRWLGIRTPWTLSDDEVWNRTHRLGSWLFVAGGSLAFFAGLSGAPIGMLGAVLAVAAAIPAIYSYVIFRGLAAHH
jgi:uncharacterized membrane protein